MLIEKLIGTIEDILARQQWNLWELSDSDSKLREHIKELSRELPLTAVKDENKSPGQKDLPLSRDISRQHILKGIEQMATNQNMRLYELIENKTELQNQFEEFKEHQNRFDSTPNSLVIKTELRGKSDMPLGEMPQVNLELEQDDDGRNEIESILLSNVQLEVIIDNEDAGDGGKGKTQPETKIIKPKRSTLNCLVCRTKFTRRAELKAHSRACCVDCKCPYCENKYTTRMILSRHVRTVHLSAASEKFVCTLCKKGFRNQQLRKTHLLDVHNVNQPYPCPQCPLTFDSINRFQDHMNRHSGAKPYKCDICSATFHTKHKIEQHMITKHSATSKFLCNECGITFNSRSTLRYHLLRHSNEQKFACTDCEKLFYSKNALLRHTQFHHTNPSKYSCSECNKNFSSKSVLDGHMIAHRGEKAFECDVCHRKFFTRKRVNEHKKLVHGPKKAKQLLLCSECDKPFTSKEGLQMHLARHTDVRGFECPQCPKKYATQKDLMVHIRNIHTLERKSYTCEICNSTLTSIFSYKRHKIAHTKPFKCDLCEKSFGSAGNLNHHLMVHSGEKPYNCDICNRPFRQQHEMKIHRRIHTGEKPYTCQYCDRRYADKRNMAKHLKVHRK